MIIGLFALNIREGGGLTHLIKFLSNLDDKKKSFHKIILWSSKETLDSIEDRVWLKKIEIYQSKFYIVNRLIFFFLRVKKLAIEENCNVLFFPGGSINTSFRPVVTMHRNLLPFETKEILRHGFSFDTFKLFALRFLQTKSMKKSNAVIFLTEFARKRVKKIAGELRGKDQVIYHGIDSSFFRQPKEQYNISSYSNENPFKIINVSLFQPYKHQWNLAEAVANLREKGLPVECHFIGGGHTKSVNRLLQVIEKNDSEGAFLKYHGSVDHTSLPSHYKNAHLMAYTSSVETFGQTLLEGMAAGLPVACSNMSCMPEILGDSGLYFNPLYVSSIEDCLTTFIMNEDLRSEKASLSFKKSSLFTWTSSAHRTLDVLLDVVKSND